LEPGDPEKPLEHNIVVVDAFTRRIADMATRVNA
jgi:hypothetical protein